jgi:hypothetical protein
MALKASVVKSKIRSAVHQMARDDIEFSITMALSCFVDVIDYSIAISDVSIEPDTSARGLLHVRIRGNAILWRQTAETGPVYGAGRYEVEADCGYRFAFYDREGTFRQQLELSSDPIDPVNQAYRGGASGWKYRKEAQGKNRKFFAGSN